MTKNVKYRYCSPYLKKEGGVSVKDIMSFLLSIMAQIIADYLSKRIDRVSSSSDPEK